ncbi:MAG: porin, partial [Gammaproteobacteria bacterium]
MKKSLLALAVLGAFAGAAAAQTNVTLYGIADAGIGWTDTDKANADGIARVVSGTQSTSRFGIRGSEDLGGGLKATFNIEAGVNWDTGAADSTFW